jgi:hypothetical protein
MAAAVKVFEFPPAETTTAIEGDIVAYTTGKTVVAVTHQIVRGMNVYTVFTS